MNQHSPDPLSGLNGSYFHTSKERGKEKGGEGVVFRFFYIYNLNLGGKLTPATVTHREKDSTDVYFCSRAQVDTG